MNVTIDIYLIYVVRALELTLVSILLFLNFGFNNHLYRKLCGKCHRGCLKLCINVMAIRYRRRLSKEIAAIDRDTGALGGALLVNKRGSLNETTSNISIDNLYTVATA